MKWNKVECPQCGARDRLKEINPEWLRSKREEHGWTQGEVARQLQIARPSISQYEAGDRPVPRYVIEHYQDRLDRTVP